MCCSLWMCRASNTRLLQSFPSISLVLAASQFTWCWFVQEWTAIPFLVSCFFTSFLCLLSHFSSVLLVSPMSSRKAILPPVERESKGKIAFLDVQPEKKGPKILTSAFRKKTHTDQYLHFHSNHPARVKRGIIQCLRHRAEKVCNGRMQWPEIRHLRQVFKANGYPETVVKWNLQARPIPTNFS